MAGDDMMFIPPPGADCRGQYELSLCSQIEQRLADIKLERYWQDRVRRNAALKDPVAREIRRRML